MRIFCVLNWQTTVVYWTFGKTFTTLSKVDTLKGLLFEKNQIQHFDISFVFSFRKMESSFSLK